ncbi:hypothetical protein LF929_009545 [Dickeya oryzae]|uniref:Uncharacterized protein n=1 Tax=Dickeya oryzae TaxID=1240404 RepID=A0AB39IYD2_9GAMM|nr:hypothetical protein [Dickeya oryzae]MCA6989533.1 hypothetical protein [Dickeya oryzae]
MTGLPSLQAKLANLQTELTSEATGRRYADDAERLAPMTALCVIKKVG